MGEPLGGRYRIGAPIGGGSMGEVFHAEDLEGRHCAVKVLRPEFAGSPEFLAQFAGRRHELVALRGTHLVPVLDLVIDAGVLAVVTAFVPGGDLRHLLYRGPLAPAEAARLGAGVARGLASAHAAGVAHGGLKPKDVVVDYGPHPSAPRLVDVGLSTMAAVAGFGSHLSSAHRAPELWHGAPPSEAGDLYALGVLLYEMAAGVPPYVGEVAHVRRMHLEFAPSRPEGMSEWLWDLIVELTAADPALRPPSAAHVATRLDALALLVAGAPPAPATETPPEPRPRPAATAAGVVAAAGSSGPAAANEASPAAGHPAANRPVRPRRPNALPVGLAALGLFAAGATVWALSALGGNDDAPKFVASPQTPVEAEAVPVPTQTQTPSPTASPLDERTVQAEATESGSGDPAAAAPAAVEDCAPAQTDPDGGLSTTLRSQTAGGSCRADVRMAQEALGVTPANGYFGPKTREAVRRHQQTRCVNYPSAGDLDSWTWDSAVRGRTQRCPSVPPAAGPSVRPSPTAQTTPTGEPDPTTEPSTEPSAVPTAASTAAPGEEPTAEPTAAPGTAPTTAPTPTPTAASTPAPAAAANAAAAPEPSPALSAASTRQPEPEPSVAPTAAAAAAAPFE